MKRELKRKKIKRIGERQKLKNKRSHIWGEDKDIIDKFERKKKAK